MKNIFQTSQQIKRVTEQESCLWHQFGYMINCDEIENDNKK